MPGDVRPGGYPNESGCQFPLHVRQCYAEFTCDHRRRSAAWKCRPFEREPWRHESARIETTCSGAPMKQPTNVLEHLEMIDSIVSATIRKPPARATVDFGDGQVARRPDDPAPPTPTPPTPREAA